MFPVFKEADCVFVLFLRGTKYFPSQNANQNIYLNQYHTLTPENDVYKIKWLKLKLFIIFSYSNVELNHSTRIFLFFDF